MNFFGSMRYIDVTSQECQGLVSLPTLITVKDIVAMDSKVGPQIVFRIEYLVTDRTGRWSSMPVVSVPGKLLPSLAHEVTLITVNQGVTSLVLGQLTG